MTHRQHVCVIVAVAREAEAFAEGARAAGGTPIDDHPRRGPRSTLALLAAAATPSPAPDLVAWTPDLAFMLSGSTLCTIRTAGVGRVNAAVAATRAILSEEPPDVLVSAGVAGSLPPFETTSSGAPSPAPPAAAASPAIGTLVLASEAVYAEEGLLGPDGFVTTDEMGFPLGPFSGNRIPADAELLERVEAAAQTLALSDARAIVRGPVATVATCSGTDAGARTVAHRTAAIAEAMEGAAVLHVASVQRVPGLELRGISNTTGDRPAQRWDLDAGLEAVSLAARALATVFSDPPAQSARTD